MSDPGDQWQDSDRKAVEEHTQERRQKLFDLAHGCDTDAAREDAIDALETVRKAHEPAPPPTWPGRI